MFNKLREFNKSLFSNLVLPWRPFPSLCLTVCRNISAHLLSYLSGSHSGKELKSSRLVLLANGLHKNVKIGLQ